MPSQTADLVKPPKLYYGWIVLAIAILFEMLSAGIYVTFTFFVRPWSAEFGGSQATVLLAVSLAHIGFILISSTVGFVIDRLDIRWIILIGVLAIAIGLFALTFAQSIAQIIAAYAITVSLAMGCAGLLSAQTLAAKWFQARRGLALGLVSVGGKLSGFVFAPIVVALLAQFGWRGTFYILSAMGLALVPIILFFVRGRPEELGLAPDAVAAPAQKEAIPAALGVKDILRHRNFWIAGISIMIPTMTVGAVVHILDPLAHQLGITESNTAFVAQLISVVGVFSLLFGGLADRFDHRWLLMGAITIVAAGSLLLVGVTGLTRLGIAEAMVGLGNSGVFPVIGSIIGRTFGRSNFGRVMGLIFMFILIGALGPLLAGAAHDRFGSYDLFFLIAAVSMMVLGSIVFWLKPAETSGYELGAIRPKLRAVSAKATVK